MKPLHSYFKADLFEKIISLPKSIYVSFKLFPLQQALKIPVLCRYNVKCKSLKGNAVVKKRTDLL